MKNELSGRHRASVRENGGIESNQGVCTKIQALKLQEQVRRDSLVGG